jgi:hypothetical protein
VKTLLRDILIIVGLVAVAYVAWPHVSQALGLGQTTAVRIEDRQPAQIIEIQVQAPAGVVGDAYQAQPAQPTPTLAPTAPGLTSTQADRIQRDLAEMQAAIVHLGEALKQCQQVYGANRCGQIENQIAFVMAQQRALLIAAAQAGQ